MVDAGPEPTYKEKMRVSPPPGATFLKMQHFGRSAYIYFFFRSDILE